MPLQTTDFLTRQSAAHYVPEWLAKRAVLMLAIALLAWCSDGHDVNAGGLYPFRPVWKLSETRGIPLASVKLGDRNGGERYRLHIPHTLAVSRLTIWPEAHRASSSGISHT